MQNHKQNIYSHEFYLLYTPGELINQQVFIMFK